MGFPEWLQEQLDRRDMNPNGLSEVLGLSHVAVGDWLRGDNKPGDENCRRLARYFGRPQEEVFAAAGKLVPTPVDDPVLLELAAKLSALPPALRTELQKYIEFRYADYIASTGQEPQTEPRGA